MKLGNERLDFIPGSEMPKKLTVVLVTACEVYETLK